MLWFRKRTALPASTPLLPEQDLIAEGFIKPMQAQELLSSTRRQNLLAHIWQRTSLSRTQFNTLYLKPIERYAELVQLFPASEAHHHAYAGGMLDHGLEIIAYALKLRQSYLLPIGSNPETQAAQAEAWTACTAYAALLHDIGKIAVDLYVEYEDGQIWHPWHGAINRPYRFKYIKGREYRLHSVCAGLLSHQILDASIMDWLSKTPDLWSSLIYVLAGQLEYAGVLGEIVTKADQSSVAQELGGNPEKAMTAPKHALHRKLLDGLRYLIKEQQLQINNAGPADGWLTEDALWLVSKTVADKLRAYLLSQGISGIPSNNSDIFNVLQEHGILIPTADNKAIWNAIVSNEKGWQTKFTFFKLAPSLIWDKNDKPTPFTGKVTIINELPDTTSENLNIPTTEATISPTPADSNTVVQADSLEALFDLLESKDFTTPSEETQPSNSPIVTVSPEPNIPEAVPASSVSSEITTQAPSTNHNNQPSGEHFVEWFKQSILNKKLIINDAQALVHTVSNTIYMVSPGIFVRYVQEFPQIQVLAKEDNIPEWRWAQKEFERLKLHKKQHNGLNIWTCTVKGPYKTKQVHGYLFAKPDIILPEIPFNNPYLSIIEAEQSR